MTHWAVWRATREDEAALVRLEAEAFQRRSWGAQSVRDSFVADRVTILMAGKSRAAPVGFAIWRDLEGEAEILTIGVAPDAQGKGAAKALLAAMLEGAKSAASTRVFLEVDGENQKALALYKDAGFEEAGVRRAYYRDGADALFMQLPL